VFDGVYNKTNPENSAPPSEHDKQNDKDEAEMVAAEIPDPPQHTITSTKETPDEPMLSEQSSLQLGQMTLD